MPEFDRSLTVYPVKDATTFYKLHYYFSKVNYFRYLFLKTSAYLSMLII